MDMDTAMVMDMATVVPVGAGEAMVMVTVGMVAGEATEDTVVGGDADGGAESKNGKMTQFN